MANLRPIVEISWTTTALNPSPVWVDVSAWVMMEPGVSIQRGRADQYSTVSGATANFVLDNQDGRFTPERSSSPYYPNVVREKRVRISVTDGTTTWRRFYGFIDVMTPGWSPAAFHSTVVVSCVDWFKFLAKVKLTDVISAEALSHSPYAWFTLGDAADSDRAANLVDPDHPAFITGKTVTFGTATGPGTDNLTGAIFAGAGSLGTKYQIARNPTGLVWTLAAWFNCSSIPTGNDRRLISMSNAVGTDTKRLAIQATTGYLTTGAGGAGTSGVSVCDGATHLAVYAYNANTNTGHLYLDGVLVATDSLIIPSTFNEIQIGNVINDPPWLSFQGTIAQAGLFYAELSAADVLNLWEAGHDGNNGETAGNRFLTLGRLAGIDASELATTATKPVQFVDTTNQDILSLMRQVEVTEAGVIFVDVNGVLQFDGHNDRYNLPAAITLTAGQYESDLQPTLDDFGIYDSATVQAPNLPEQRYSRGLGDKAPASLSTLDMTTERMLSRARWETRSSVAKLRWPSVSIDLLTQTSIRAAVLTADIGARITLSGLPASAPTSSVDLFLEGYNETISLSTYNVTCNCSPFTPTNLWKLGDTTYSVLGSTTKLAF